MRPTIKNSRHTLRPDQDPNNAGYLIYDIFKDGDEDERERKQYCDCCGELLPVEKMDTLCPLCGGVPTFCEDELKERIESCQHTTHRHRSR